MIPSRSTSWAIAPLALTLALAACGDDAQRGEAADALFTDLADGATAPPDTAPAPVCGDGLVESPEVCDDGAKLNGTYERCAADCAGPGPRCGDGVTDAAWGEVCDDGDGVNGVYGHCGAACTSPAPFCGNDFIDDPSEVCDDGEDNGAYGFCRADCGGAGPACGDGAVDTPWELCDDGPDNGTDGRCAIGCGKSPDCGDGELRGAEVCDDGADNGTYGHCAADCSGPGPACGDGVAQRAFGEVCDHGADNGTYGHCAIDCGGLGPRCGDGTLQAPQEVCDDGADNGTPGACREDCGGRALPWPVSPSPTAAAAVVDGLSCDEHDWLAKYMRYRRRLRGDGTAAFPGFVSVGAAPGQSMPASRREPNSTCVGYWEFESCPRTELPGGEGLYKWGDGTIWLGGYLEVLGTERAVFADLGLDTSETERDLAYALFAFDRLDLEAEAGFTKPPTLDGFFLRDDVPRDFVTTPSGAWRFPRTGGADGYGCVASNLSCEPPTVESGSFVSQDQVIGLLHGLALVARFVPDGVVVDGVDLRYKARELVHRMVSFLRDGGWRVTDPNGDHPPDAWGGNAIGFSNQLAKAANALAAPDFGVDDYRTLASRTVGEAAWAGIIVIWSVTHFYNRTMALKLNAITNDWSADTTAKRAVGDSKDFYALTHALLNDVPVGAAFSPWRVESVLDSAACSGPCRHTPGCAEAPGWKGEHRIWSPEDRAGSRHFGEAEFNGLDYMALFNAYFLYRRGHLGFAVPAPPPGAACDAFVGLDRLTSAPVPAGTTYDPANPCVAIDAERRFCGRAFASWLDAAYRGEATIWTHGARWRCADGAPCVLDTSSGGDHTDGDDLIIGSTGNDTLRGGNGDDCLYGLAGDDVLEGGQGYDELHGGDGNDRLYGEGSGWIILDGERDELYGEAGDDVLEGGPDDDALYGGVGDDTLDGGAGGDILDGGDGHDELRGRGGDDTLDGGPGDDSLIGDAGDDILWGGPGRDKLDGEAGDDYVDGGEGDDFVRGGTGDDTLIGGPGQDRLCGNGGDDTLWGGWDGDTCRGGGFLGGRDKVVGCDDDSASQSECNNSAFNAW